MLHKSMTPGKWRSYGQTNQILMIANEMNRARRAEENNQDEQRISALIRAIELIDLSVSIAGRPALRRELLRFGELVRGLTVNAFSSTIVSALEVLLSFDRIAYQQISAMGLRSCR